jgi:hypothetical protein
MNIYEEFSRKNIIDNLAKYEMYYQVSSGKLVKSTDSSEIKYEIELDLALGSIYEMIKDILGLENYTQIFNDELKKQSSIDSLQNFVNQNLEAVKNQEIKIETILNEINENKFFNQTMIEICEKNEKSQIIKWQQIITEELADNILKSLSKLE